MTTTPKTATAGSDDGEGPTYGDGWLDALARLRLDVGQPPLNELVARAIRRAANDGDTRRAEQNVWLSAMGVGRPRGPLTARHLIREMLKVPAEALDMPAVIELEGENGGTPESLEVMGVIFDAEQDETTGDVVVMRTVVRARRP